MDFSYIKKTSTITKVEETQLNNVVSEIRNKIYQTTKEKGGHLSANLGVVELTVALHAVFDFPTDKLIFDVGHQCYTHKILSGRDIEFDKLREKDGISGFPDKDESDFDPFTVGHAGCSMSSANGLCMARDKVGDDYYVVSIVGDGSIVNGENLEALMVDSNKPKKFIVIFNDNGMSISENVNGLYKYINKKTGMNKRITEKTIDVVNPITDGIFERFGFKYVGIADGNDTVGLIKILRKIKVQSEDKAIFLHIKTVKGKGFSETEKHADIYHGIAPKGAVTTGGFATTLGNKLNKLIKEEKRIVAITCAMKDGTGLSLVEKENPDNFIDVGIAEDYAVTLAGGLAKGGLKPIVALYSTFMQRAYDQLLHDVCLQNLPVVFTLDRAGFVGADGITHQGLFDLSFLSNLPNMVVLSPFNEADLEKALDYAFSLNCPVAIRYPKSSDVEIKPLSYDESLWQTLKDGEKLNIFAVGPKMVKLAMEVEKRLDFDCKVVAIRSIKPLDTKYFDGKPIVTLEENMLNGGFGSNVATYFNKNGKTQKILSFGVDDVFVKHAEVEAQLRDNGLSVENIAEKIKEFIK